MLLAKKQRGNKFANPEGSTFLSGKLRLTKVLQAIPLTLGRLSSVAFIFVGMLLLVFAAEPMEAAETLQSSANEIVPRHDPADQPFRRAPLTPATRSIVIPLATNLHLAFDAQLLRTLVVWKGDGLALYGPPYHGKSDRFICDFAGELLWETPPFFPWSIGSLPTNGQTNSLPFVRFKGLSIKSGRTTLLYELSLPNRKTVEIHEVPRRMTWRDKEGVLRRFEIGPCEKDLWFLAHAEVGAFAVQPAKSATLIRRETDLLLATIHSDANVNWENHQQDVSYNQELWLEKEKGECGMMRIPVSGSRAMAYLKIPAHSQEIALEIATITCSSEAEVKEALTHLSKSSVAKPKMDFLTDAEKAVNASPPKKFSSEANSIPRIDGDKHYAVEHFLLPKEIDLRVTGMDFLSNGDLAVCTWGGEVYIVEHVQSDVRQAAYRRFARGLNEPLGLKVIKDRIYVTQKCELTRLQDTDGNGEADLFENINADWGYNGHYHTFVMGPTTDAEGNIYVFINGTHTVWEVPYMGWCLKISPDGRHSEGFCNGLRSPHGFGTYGPNNDLFTTDNQGHWVGACKLNHLQKGKFYGYPSSSPAPLENFDKPTNFVPPAVWFPYSLAKSVSGLATIPANRFGPFEGQMLAGDFQNAIVVRVALEKVNGEWQGAVWPFAKGFSSGVNRLSFGPDGKLYVGGGKGGHWSGAVGPQLWSLDRVGFKGNTPFEVKEARAMTNGFELVFTESVNAEEVANPENYDVSQFTYKYHGSYGSPEIDHEGKQNSSTEIKVEKAEVSDDRRKVRLVLGGLKAGYVTKIRISGLANGEGKPLWHDTFWYTLNQIPR